MVDDVAAEDVSACRSGFDDLFVRGGGVFGLVEPQRWAGSSDGKFRAFLEARRLPYVVEVRVHQTVTDLDGRRRVDTLVGRAPAEAWHQISAGPGVRGEREYDWAWATPPSFGDVPVGYVRRLLARRALDDPTISPTT